MCVFSRSLGDGGGLSVEKKRMGWDRKREGIGGAGGRVGSQDTDWVGLMGVVGRTSPTSKRMILRTSNESLSGPKLEISR